jgi:lipopolysaccharide export system permease protein
VEGTLQSASCRGKADFYHLLGWMRGGNSVAAARTGRAAALLLAVRLVRAGDGCGRGAWLAQAARPETDGMGTMRYPLVFRYLFMQHLKLALLVMLVMLLVVQLGQYTDMAKYQSAYEHWSVLTSLKLSLYRTPAFLPGILPHVVLVSGALAVARACRRSEVTVMMQNGLSYGQVLLPVAAAAAVLGVMFALVVQPIASRTMNASEDALMALRGAAVADHGNSREFMIRDGDGANYILIDHVSGQGGVLYGVTVYRVDGGHTLLHAQQAEEAILTETGLRLVNPREVYRSRSLQAGLELPREVTVARTAIAERFDSQDTVSFYKLPGMIALGRIVGAAVHELQVEYYWLLTLPVLLGSISFLAGAVVIRPMQRGGWQGDAAMILSAAFVIYTMSTVLDALGNRAAIAPLVSVIPVPLLALATGAGLLWLKRRGGRLFTQRRVSAGRQRQVAIAGAG